MRKTLLSVGLAAVLATPGALAQTTNRDGASGAGVKGLPGNKSGPAVNPSGQTQSPSKAPSSDQSGVQGLPGNKSGPPQQAPKQ